MPLRRWWTQAAKINKQKKLTVVRELKSCSTLLNCLTQKTDSGFAFQWLFLWAIFLCLVLSVRFYGRRYGWQKGTTRNINSKKRCIAKKFFLHSQQKQKIALKKGSGAGLYGTTARPIWRVLLRWACCKSRATVAVLPFILRKKKLPKKFSLFYDFALDFFLLVVKEGLSFSTVARYMAEKSVSVSSPSPA